MVLSHLNLWMKQVIRDQQQKLYQVLEFRKIYVQIETTQQVALMVIVEKTQYVTEMHYNYQI